MKVFAIDPGPTQSAFVHLIKHDGIRLPDIEQFGIEDNYSVLGRIGYGNIVIEKIASYGMAVGAEVFETVFWSGRFAERGAAKQAAVDRIERLRVKLQLCQDSRAKDANIRQALIDRWGGAAAIKKGGALYGVSKDVWAALAVGMTWIETRIEVETAAPERTAAHPAGGRGSGAGDVGAA